MKYAIISDVAADLSVEAIKDNKIKMIPMDITIDDKVYKHTEDYENMSSEEFYNMLRSGKMPVTSQINSFVFEEEFRPFLEIGKDIIYICLSSKLSGLYEQAKFAAKNLMEKYPDRKIFVVDSLCATGGQGLLVKQASKNSKSMTIEENVKALEESILDYSLWFAVEDLKHLKRGGRLSATSAIIGSALNIKPVLHIADDGKLVPIVNARGSQRALKEIVCKYETNRNTNYLDEIVICHADDYESAKKLESMLIKDYGFSNIDILPLSPIIGSHVGAGMISLHFRGKR